MLNHFRRRLDDFLGILEQHVRDRAFVVGDRATIADLSMSAYLSYPKEEAGYDFVVSHPAIMLGSAAWRRFRDGAHLMICCQGSA